MTTCVFTSVTEWVCHPEMFTEPTRRQMRSQKSHVCMTQAAKCFCSSHRHWQRIEWQVQTQPSQPNIPVPAAAHGHAAGAFPFPGNRCWRDILSQDGMIVRERFLSTVPTATLSVWEEISMKQLQQVSSPCSSLNWQDDWHFTSKHRHTNMLKHCKLFTTCNDFDKRTYSPTCNYICKDEVLLWGKVHLSLSGPPLYR